MAGKHLVKLDAERALVTAVDFAAPVVDDAYDYGRIAAAAALSRIYAMGATPLCAVAIAAFPQDLDGRIVGSVFLGGVDKCAEAGVPIAGGHTIKDPVPKYGLYVTGTTSVDRIANDDAVGPEDVLILTKPLGTGILAAARHDDAIDDEAMAPAIESMAQLDAAAGKAALDHGVGAMTAVRAYGLMGHLGKMLGSDLGARIDAGKVPIFARALALAAHDAVPSGTRANVRNARAAGVRFSPAMPVGLRAVLCDMQTSGGLLMAVRPERADALMAALAVTDSRAIGTVTRGSGIEVVWEPAKQ